MKLEITTERIFEIIDDSYKIRAVAIKTGYTPAYVYAVKAGKMKMSAQLRNSLCAFLVERALENMQAIYGDEAVEFFEHYIKLSGQNNDKQQ